MADRAWPSTVIPSDAYERAQATGVLFRRMGWVTERLTRDERDDVERQLAFWYGNGYCPDALLIALSALPDGTRQRPRGPGERPGDFLRTRLAGWFREGPDAVHDPPRKGQSFEAWFDNARRQAAAEGTGRRSPRLTEAGQRARQQALAAAKRKDPLTRLRERERRRTAALDSLRVEGGPAVVDAAPSPSAAQRATPRMVASFAARQSAAARSPQVVRIVARLRAEKRAPSPAELALLRNALRDAHHHAGLDTLSAATSQVGTGGPTGDGLRALSFLDHATDDGLPLDATVLLLTTAVDETPITEQQ